MNKKQLYAYLAGIGVCAVCGWYLFRGPALPFKTFSLGVLGVLVIVSLPRSRLLFNIRGNLHPFASPVPIIDERRFRASFFFPILALAVIGWLSLALAYVGLIGVVVFTLNMGFRAGLHVFLFGVVAAGVSLWSWGAAFKGATRRELGSAALTGVGVIVVGILMKTWV